MAFHENIHDSAVKEGLKGRKLHKAVESFTWNITILKVSSSFGDRGGCSFSTRDSLTYYLSLFFPSYFHLVRFLLLVCFNYFTILLV